MRNIALQSVVVLIGVLCLCFLCVGDPAPPAPEASAESKVLAYPELVAEFYRVLTQDAAPTYQQEKDLFGSSNLRKHLIDKEGLEENQPIILSLFRKNRDLFMTKNKADIKDLRGIRISSSFKILGSPGALRPSRQSGSFVIAMFIDDATAKQSGLRSVMFSVNESGDDRGKLGPDSIYFGGFDGVTAYEKFFDEKWALENLTPDDLN